MKNIFIRKFKKKSLIIGWDLIFGPSLIYLICFFRSITFSRIYIFFISETLFKDPAIFIHKARYRANVYPPQSSPYIGFILVRTLHHLQFVLCNFSECYYFIKWNKIYETHEGKMKINEGRLEMIKVENMSRLHGMRGRRRHHINEMKNWDVYHGRGIMF